MSKKGFTLIEMLIVIAIIGILASIVLVGIGPVQRQARDSRRASDLRQVQNALELYFSKAGDYPAVTDWAALTTALTTGANAVVPRIPAETRTGWPAYDYEVVGSGYVLAATLEDDTSPLLQNDIDGNQGSIDCGAGAPESPAVYCIQF